MPRRILSIEERFWNACERRGEDECWLWRNPRPNGYGQIQEAGRGSKTLAAHRVAYELFVGPIPQGLEIDHLCENRACVNPAHLEPVQHEVNSQRFFGKRTHCKNGHPFDGWKRVNDRGHLSMQRYCKTCGRAATSRYYYKQKAAA